MGVILNRTMEDWDPLHPSNTTNRVPTIECRKRIRRDLKAMRDDPLPLIFPTQDEMIGTIIHALVVGPFDTPYEGGFFWFVLNCPDDYPNQPPKVKLMTTGGGSVRFNPNLYANGKVCLSILGTWAGPGWSPAQSISSVLMSIQSLMNAKPYHNEPGFEVAQDPRDVENYNDCICFEKMNVAVCEMVGDNTMSQAMPEHLRILARDLFPSVYDAHLLTCSNLIERGKDGKLMIDPFGENRGSMQFSKVRARLEALNQLLSDGNSQSLNFETTISSTGPLGYIGAAAEEVAAGVAKK
jgi:ubiquitin-conjugating enzyme E2 Z